MSDDGRRDGWKVVFKTEDGRLMSAWMAMRASKVEYVPGAAARPRDRCGPLCVFDSLAAAESFRNQLSRNGRVGLEVWPCRYLPSAAPTPWVCDVLDLRFFGVLQTPAGTVLADEVMLGSSAVADRSAGVQDPGTEG